MPDPTTDVTGLYHLVNSLHQRFDRLAEETTEAGRKVTVIETTVLSLKDELKPDGQHSAITKIALNEQRVLTLEAKLSDLEEKLEAKESEARQHKRLLWVSIAVAAIGLVGAVAGGIVTAIKW